MITGDFDECGGAGKAPGQSSGRGGRDNQIIGSLNDGEGKAEKRSCPPRGAAGTDDLVDDRGGERYLADCLADGRVVQIGRWHGTVEITTYKGIIEVSPGKRLKLFQKQSDERPERLMPPLAELPEWSEENEMIGRNRAAGGKNGECATHRKTDQNYPGMALAQGKQPGSDGICPFVTTAARERSDLMAKARKKGDVNRRAIMMDQCGEGAHLGWCARETVDEEHRHRKFSFQPEGQMLLTFEGLEVNRIVLIHCSLFSIFTTQRYNVAGTNYQTTKKKWR